MVISSEPRREDVDAIYEFLRCACWSEQILYDVVARGRWRIHFVSACSIVRFNLGLPGLSLTLRASPISATFMFSNRILVATWTNGRLKMAWHPGIWRVCVGLLW